MSIVQNHLTATVSNMQEQNIQPPIPDTFLNIDTTEQYIPIEQESPFQRLHASFDAAQIEEAGFLDNINQYPDQGEHQ